jgi:hypothetical protein
LFFDGLPTLVPGHFSSANFSSANIFSIFWQHSTFFISSCFVSLRYESSRTLSDRSGSLQEFLKELEKNEEADIEYFLR